MNRQLFIYLDLNGIVALFPPLSMRDTELNPILRISSVQRRTFLCLYHLVGEALTFKTFCNTDVSAPFGDHKYNRRDTDVSRSGKLCLGVHTILLFPSSLALIIVGGFFC
jgi:hypothetical protein